MTYQVPGFKSDQFCDIQLGAGEVLLKFGEGFVHHLSPFEAEVLGKSLLLATATLTKQGEMPAAEPELPPEPKRPAFKVIEGGNA